MVYMVDCSAGLRPLAQFSPMVWRKMATMACPSVRSCLRLHFCHRSFICSAPLHPLHLLSVLSPKRGIKLHEKKDRRSQLEDEYDAGRVGAICGIVSARCWRNQ